MLMSSLLSQGLKCSTCIQSLSSLYLLLNKLGVEHSSKWVLTVWKVLHITHRWGFAVNLKCISHTSPTLYSQIAGKYASVESKIFPHILLLCSISYSCFNGLTINQHFIKPLQGEKCTSYLSVVDLSIVLPRVFFFAALCGRTNLRLRSHARTPTKLLRSTF